MRRRRLRSRHQFVTLAEEAGNSQRGWTYIDTLGVEVGDVVVSYLRSRRQFGLVLAAGPTPESVGTEFGPGEPYYRLVDRLATKAERKAYRRLHRARRREAEAYEALREMERAL